MSRQTLKNTRQSCQNSNAKSQPVCSVGASSTRGIISPLKNQISSTNNNNSNTAGVMTSSSSSHKKQNFLRSNSNLNANRKSIGGSSNGGVSTRSSQNGSLTSGGPSSLLYNNNNNNNNNSNNLPSNSLANSVIKQIVRKPAVPQQSNKPNRIVQQISIQKQMEMKQAEQLQRRKMLAEKYKFQPGMGQDSNYKYIVLKGNNSVLIRRVLEERRPYWSETTNYSQNFNFKWSPISKFIHFERTPFSNIHNHRIVNHFEHHEEISSKVNLMRNMHIFCELNKINVFDLLPVTFILSLDDNSFNSNLQKFGKFFKAINNQIERFDEIKMERELEALKNKKSEDNPPVQFKIKTKAEIEQQMQQKNRQDKQFQLGLEEELRSNINQKLAAFPYKNDRIKVSYTKVALHRSFINASNLWMLKVSNFNRGRGIYVFNTLEILKKHLHQVHNGIQFELPNQKKNTTFSSAMAVQNTHAAVTSRDNKQKSPNSGPNKRAMSGAGASSNANNTNNKNNEEEKQENKQAKQIVKGSHFVIQKYVERPMLIDQRKFDFRVWVLVSWDMKVYFYRQGYIRTASKSYTLDEKSLDLPYVHLTNSAVQRFAGDYGKFQDNNQLSFDQFQEYIDRHYEQGQRGNVRDMVDRMKQIVRISMQSVRKKLNPEDRQFCFQLFGYDFLIDEDFKIWLIQVNTNPCLEQTSSWLRKLLPRMIDDTFKLTLDVIFPPKKPGMIARKASVDEDSMECGRQSIQQQQQKPRQYVQSYPVDKYPDDLNLWDFICQIGLNKTVANMKQSIATQQARHQSRYMAM